MSVKVAEKYKMIWREKLVIGIAYHHNTEKRRRRQSLILSIDQHKFSIDTAIELSWKD